MAEELFAGMTPEEIAEIKQIVADFRLMDDDFMSIVFNDDPELVGFVLGIILERDDLKVESVKTQVEYKSLMGRSIRLDIKAVDKLGKVYNIEIQRSDRGAQFRRARFYSSMIDSGLLEKAQDFNELVDTYVIFITERDKFGKGLPLYHIDRMVRELGISFEDGAHIIFVNGEYRKDDRFGKLMHDFHCRSGRDMFYPTIAERVDYFKVTEGGNEQMCRSVENLTRKYEERGERRGEQRGEQRGIQQGIQQGMQQGMRQGIQQGVYAQAVETARKMLMMKSFPVDMIAKLNNLSVEEVEKLAKQCDN